VNTEREITVLIIEDGNEYLENLSRFVRGYTYLQAHTGLEARQILASETVDVIYLDMRFDRIPIEDLIGDLEHATRIHNGDENRGLKYIQNNQGLYILADLKEHGFDSLPVIVAYDFSREPQRYEHLARRFPTLQWVPDAVTPAEIRERIEDTTSHIAR